MTETKKCMIEACKKPYRAKGYCELHFKQWRAGEIEGHKARYKICSEENCKKPIFKRGMCEQHFGAWAASKKGLPAETAAPAAETAAPAPAPAAEAAKPAETTPTT